MIKQNGLECSDDGKVLYKIYEEVAAIDEAGHCTIPSSIEEIEEAAFINCSTLKTLDISHVKSIKPRAFYFCVNLEHVTLSDSLENVGYEAFAYCKINKLTFTEGTRTIKALMDLTAYNSLRSARMNAELGLPETVSNSLTEIVIPNSVASIESGAFKDCIELSNVTLSDNVTSIGRWAFANTLYYFDDSDESVLYINNHLIDANINDKRRASGEFRVRNDVKTIADSAFRNCQDLTSVIIPASISSIGRDAFRNCTNLTSVTFESGSVERLFDSTGSALMTQDGYYLEASTYRDNLTNIGDNIFSYCSNLTIYCDKNSYAYEYFNEYFKDRREIIVQGLTK